MLLAQQPDWLGLVDAPATEGYLNSLAARLSPDTATHHIHVYLALSLDYSAFSEPATGAVYISTTALYTPQSEDEIAALLAHEMSHVLLGHRSMDKAVRAANYLIVANMFLIPIRQLVTKQEEEQADQYGIDLLSRAGFCETAMLSVIDHFGGSSEAKGPTMFDAFVLPPMTRSEVVEPQTGLNSSYPDYKSRWSNARNYIDRFYSGRLGCARHPNPTAQDRKWVDVGLSSEDFRLSQSLLAFSQLEQNKIADAKISIAEAATKGPDSSFISRYARLKLAMQSGDNSSASEQLEQMLVDPHGYPLGFFLEMAEEQEKNHDWSGTVRVIQTMINTYPNHPELLPFFIGYLSEAETAQPSPKCYLQLESFEAKCMVLNPQFLTVTPPLCNGITAHGLPRQQSVSPSLPSSNRGLGLTCSPFSDPSGG